MADAGSSHILKQVAVGIFCILACLLRPEIVAAHAEFISADPAPGSALAT